MSTAVYIPILKGKEGEFAALESLATDVRNRITPLIELPAVPYDYSNERPSKPLDEHLSSLATRIARCWEHRAICIDFSLLGSESRLSNGKQPISVMLDQCTHLGIRAIPVASRNTSDSELTSVGRFSHDSQNGTCLRLSIGDFEDDIDLDEEVTRIFDRLQSSPDQADLLLDLQDIGTDSSRATLLARSIFGMIPRRDEWRQIILSATSFPEDLSEVDASTTSILARKEWQLWGTLQKRRTLLPRPQMVYSDYAIAHPESKELDPRKIRMSANIRYTTWESWLILKGRNVRQYGFDQYFDLCRTLVERQEYAGPNFSWADMFIYECAQGVSGPGNATTWRKVGTNHHITLVVKSLGAVQNVS